MPNAYESAWSTANKQTNLLCQKKIMVNMGEPVTYWVAHSALDYATYFQLQVSASFYTFSLVAF